MNGFTRLVKLLVCMTACITSLVFAPMWLAVMVWLLALWALPDLGDL